MDSSLGNAGLPHRGHKQIIVIIFQSIIILWLAAWSIGDYLNNIYVHAYVDAQLAAYGWIALLGIVGGSLGSAWTMVHKRHAALGKGIEKPVKVKESKKENKKGVSLPKIPTPSLQAPSKPSINPKLASIGIRTSSLSSISNSASSPIESVPAPSSQPISFTQSPTPVDSGQKPAIELHPAVAALKAELSERKVTLGLVSATVGQDTGPRSPPSFQNQPQVVDRPSLPVEPRPIQRIEPMNNTPPTVIRPAPGPSQMRPMQSPQPQARPMQPFSFNRPAPQLPVNNPRPVLPTRPIQPGAQDRFEDAMSRAGFIPTQTPENQNPATQSRPAPPPIPRNVSTVITGIMPVKKKDPQDSNSQDSSRQNNPQ